MHEIQTSLSSQNGLKEKIVKIYHKLLLADLVGEYQNKEIFNPKQWQNNTLGPLSGGNAWNTANASSFLQNAIFFSRPDKFEQI